MKIFKYFINLVKVACLCLFLNSCTLPEHVYIYNNTASVTDIIFVADDKEHVFSVLPNKMLKFKVGILLDDYVVLRADGKDMCFNLISPGKGFWSYEGFGVFSKKIVFNFQIEADGNIYVLPREGNYPLKDLLFQPLGYPLKSECK